MVLEIELQVHTSSRRFRFQNLCSFSSARYDWTRSSSSYHTKKWHQWIWNSDSIHDNAKIEPPGWWYAEGKVATWKSYISTISELLSERSVFDKDGPSSSIKKTHPKQLKIQTNPVNNFSEELFWLKKGSGMTFLPANLPTETLFQPQSQNWPWDWYVIMIKMKRETDATVHWKSSGPKLRKAFQKVGRHKFSDSDWVQHIYKRSNKTRFQYCKNSKNIIEDSCYSRTHLWERDSTWVHGSRRCSIQMERMPVSSKMLLMMLLQSLNQTHRWRTRMQRKTDHLLHTSQPIRRQSRRRRTQRRPLEAEKKEHYNSMWKRRQDDVYCITLARAHDKGTRSHAIIVCCSVLTYCIYKNVSEVHRESTMLNTDNEWNREMIEEDMDFNIPGLHHSTVKQLHGASVREMIQKIENHPHRHAIQRDLQQSQSFNPFSQESTEMIHEVGNIELCELLDTEPKAQCKVCLSYWDVGIVYCTCGHFLRNGTEENKKFVQYTMDLLSIPNYYIKKGRLHGHRYGKKPGGHEYFTANSLKKKCKKRHFLGIHDRFIRDEKFRKNMFDTDRTEEMCRKMDELADEDHTHHLTPEEIQDYRVNWWIRSNKVDCDTMPIRHRPDFEQALSWLHSSYEHHYEDVPSTDWSRETW